MTGRDNKQYQVPIPRKSGWTPNAPLRKGDTWLPSPREKGATEATSKGGETAAMKKERKKKEAKAIMNKKRQLHRNQISREKAKVRENAATVVAVVAEVPAQKVPKPGENLFREVKKGRPPKESPEIQVLRKLNGFTAKDQKLILKMFDEMLEKLTIVKTEGEGKKVPTKKAIEKAAAKAADKKAAEDATTEAAEAANAGKKSAREASTEAVVAPQ